MIHLMPHIVAGGYGCASSLFAGGWTWGHCKPNKSAILKFMDRSQLLGLIAEGEHSCLACRIGHKENEKDMPRRRLRTADLRVRPLFPSPVHI